VKLCFESIYQIKEKTQIFGLGVTITAKLAYQ